MGWKESATLRFRDRFGFGGTRMAHVIFPLFLGPWDDFLACVAVRLAFPADSRFGERRVQRLPLHVGMDERPVHGEYLLQSKILSADGAVEFWWESPQGLPSPHAFPLMWFQSAYFARWYGEWQDIP